MTSTADDSKTASVMDPSVDASKTPSTTDNDVGTEKKELSHGNAPPVADSKTTSIIDPDADIEKKELNADEQPNEFQRSISDTRWVFACVGLFLAAFLYGLDTTIAADVQASILASLGEIEKLAWVGIGFPMGSVATILLIGTTYGLFEIKYLAIAGIVLFEAGSALCGAAPNMNAMIVGRVIAGIGGAGMYLGALNYMAIFTSIKARPLYNAGIGLCWGAGCILGPVIGGGLAGSGATWRWAFYINLPLAAITSPIYLFALPKFNAQPTVPWLQKLTHIDWLGAFLNAGTFCLFMVVLTFAGSTWAWDTAGPIALWAVFGVFLISYTLQSTFSITTTPERRLFPVQFLRSPTMILLYMSTAAAATALAVTIYYIPLFFQFTKGDSAILAAVRLLPFITLNIFFTMVSGGLLPVFGRYMPWYLASGILILIGGALMFKITADTSTSAIYGFEILIAVGGGLSQQIGYTIAAASVQPHEVPAAIGFINVAQIGTIAISLSIAGSIFQNVGFSDLKAALASYDFSDTDIRNALAGAQSAILTQGDETITAIAVASVASTISKLFAMIIAAGALLIVCSIFMKREKLMLTPAAGA